MIENLIIENINNLYYKATPELGYLILIPADEEEKAAAAEYGEIVEENQYEEFTYNNANGRRRK